MFCWGMRIKKNISELELVFRLSAKLLRFTVWWSLNPCSFTPLLKLSGTESFHRVRALVWHKCPTDSNHITPGRSSSCQNWISVSSLPITALCLPFSSHSIYLLTSRPVLWFSFQGFIFLLFVDSFCAHHVQGLPWVEIRGEALYFKHWIQQKVNY